MASYEETLVNISLDAHADIVVDTQRPYTDAGTPDGASASNGFQYRFVQVSGPHEANLFTGASGTRCVGVLQSKPQINDQEATVAIAGISMVEADGEINAGDGVGAGDFGRATAGGDLGIAIRGADAQGQLIPVLLLHTATAVPA